MSIDFFMGFLVGLFIAIAVHKAHKYEKALMERGNNEIFNIK